MKPGTKGFAKRDEETVTSEVAQASNHETVRSSLVKIRTKYLLAFWLGLVLAPSLAMAQTPSAPPAQANRAVGVVTQIKPGGLTLRLDAGSELQVQLPEDVTVLRVPPGAKDLKTATHITVGEINPSDRVLVRGRFSDDQKSFEATSVVVMTRSDLAAAHAAETQDWQRRGIGGVVKAVDPEKKEVTIAVPNTPPTPGNLTRPVVFALAPNAVLLRYAPDSVKFGDAKPAAFDAIKVGDQVRALGTKSEDGSRFTAEKLVSGTFRNVGATVISVDAAAAAVTVKDLASGKPLVVHTTPDSKLHELPQYLAEMIARLNSGGQGTGAAAGGAAGTAGPGATGGPGSYGGQRGPSGNGGPGSYGGQRGPGGNGGPGSYGGQQGAGGNGQGGPGGMQQMLDRLPAFTLSELKPGQALIVVSTQGEKPSEVTAIAILTGVEPILAARPKGASDMNLGPWNMGGGNGESMQ